MFALQRALALLDKHGEDGALAAHVEAQRAAARAAAWSGIEPNSANVEWDELRARVVRMIRDGGVSGPEFVALTGLSAHTRAELMSRKRREAASLSTLRHIVSALSARTHNAQAVSA